MLNIMDRIRIHTWGAKLKTKKKKNYLFHIQQNTTYKIIIF